MSKKIITRRCIDCNSILKNRSKKTKRCIECHFKFIRENKKGRTTGFCIICGEKLSTIKNKTQKCKSCYLSTKKEPWNKGMKGLTPWNKGKSNFKNEEEYKKHVRIKRKILRRNQSAEKKIPDRIRTLIRNSIKKQNAQNRKNTKTTLLLGCEISFFIKHLESQFKDGMSWENYGNGKNKWNIDHIIPCAYFDLTKIEEQKKCFHYSNCQPLWAIENIKKGCKVTY